MDQFTLLSQYNLILIRYNEIWLKSTKVKMRMLKTLMNNIKNMLNLAGIPFHKYQLSKDSSRIFFFFKNEDIPKAIEVLKRVFGIYSFSPTLRTSNKFKNIAEKALEVAEKIIQEGDSFALRVKRSGNHEYNSKEIAIKVGQIIVDKFSESDINLKVNLTNPDKRIFIEVRQDFSYIFTDIIKNDWGGLPAEGRKKIAVMDVGRINDLLGGFLLMRRGSVVYPIILDLNGDDEVFEMWISNWKEIARFVHLSKFTIRKINLSNLFKEITSSIGKDEHICAICRLLRLEVISKVLKANNNEALEGIRAISDGINRNNSTFCDDDVDLGSLSLRHIFSEYPIFTPLIGLDQEKIKEFLSKISEDFENIQYCPIKPKNQEIDIETIEKTYKSLNLNQKIADCINNIDIIDIMKD